MATYDTLTEAISDLRLKGYAQDFNLNQDTLLCPQLDLALQPDEFHVDEVYRFEGASNPDDNDVLYAISSVNDVKGLLVDAYGAYADALSTAMIQKLRVDDTTRYE